MDALKTLKHEVRTIGLVTLYFLVCFSLVLVLKKLFLAQYDVEIYVVSSAVVGALVMAKVVIILEKIGAGTRFEARAPLWITVTYKTIAYTIAAAMVLFAEKVFHAYHESETLGRAVEHVWAHRDRNVLLATIICIGLSFAGYNLYSAIDRRLGEGALRKIVFGHETK